MLKIARKLIRRRRRKKPRPEPPRDLTVTSSHLPPDVDAIVRDWFAGRITDYTRSGERSALVHKAAAGHPGIKIKGAGLNGGPIRFGVYRKTGPVAPLFDYDGRRMEDVALGHDGAFAGGASMQQAVTEWRVTRHLQELGISVLPCLGYGSVFDGQHRSWFSVFGWNSDWQGKLNPPKDTIATLREMSHMVSETLLRLAVDHRLAGFAWAIRDADGVPMLKDLHPFRKLDPMNMSQVSWVMQVYYAFHILAVSNRSIFKGRFGEETPDEVPVWMFNAFCPEATVEDWDRLRFSVVTDYIINAHPDFSTEALLDLLEGNPISARLMEHCPPEFARVR